MDQIGKFFGGDKKKKGKVRIEQASTSPHEPLLLFCLSYRSIATGKPIVCDFLSFLTDS